MFLKTIQTLFCLSLLLSSFISFPQDSSLILKKKIETKSRLITTDRIGNLYVVKGNNMLVRYNTAGDSDRVFNEIKKGAITQIDASNPLRILLFFKEYNMVVVLDQMFSQKEIIKFNSLGFYNITCIANSADGGIWAFDASQNILVKVDSKPSIRFSNALRNIFEQPVQFNFMVEEERILYASDSTEGVFSFDLYGFYNTTYHFQTSEFQWINNQLIYWKNPDVISYNTKNLQEKKITFTNEEQVYQVKIIRNHLYVRKENCIEFYQMN